MHHGVKSFIAGRKSQPAGLLALQKPSSRGIDFNALGTRLESAFNHIPASADDSSTRWTMSGQDIDRVLRRAMISAYKDALTPERGSHSETFSMGLPNSLQDLETRFAVGDIAQSMRKYAANFGPLFETHEKIPQLAQRMVDTVHAFVMERCETVASAAR